LGIPEELVMRHPFPGPGIAIRIIGDVTPERVEIVKKADNIFISMIKEAGIYNEARTSPTRNNVTTPADSECRSLKPTPASTPTELSESWVTIASTVRRVSEQSIEDGKQLILICRVHRYPSRCCIS
jgi:hypothetical protein